jgi:hypothetical protein
LSLGFWGEVCGCGYRPTGLFRVPLGATGEYSITFDPGNLNDKGDRGPALPLKASISDQSIAFTGRWPRDSDLTRGFRKPDESGRVVPWHLFRPIRLPEL